MHFRVMAHGIATDVFILLIIAPEMFSLYPNAIIECKTEQWCKSERMKYYYCVASGRSPSMQFYNDI